MPPTREQITAALRNVQEPELYKDIVTLNMVKDIQITTDGGVRIGIELTSPNPSVREGIERNVKTALAGIGVSNVQLSLTARGATGPGPATVGPRRDVLPQVKNIVAIGAGKGGVGKSTVALNLAVALQRSGATVGLMDGDIYGPSMPTMLGIKGQAPLQRGNKIVPFHVHGLHAITIGALVEPEKPLIFRGPMAQGAFKNLILDHTDWPDLDYLIIDLPPGTGDIPLTLCQLIPLTGAVVVATPQQVALDDAVRAVRMFQQLNAPVLGIIENMSFFIDDTGREHDIFGRGGAERSASELGLPYLGAIPMYTDLRVNSDSGKPHANFENNVKLGAILEAIADRLVKEVNNRNASAAPPTLTIS